MGADNPDDQFEVVHDESQRNLVDKQMFLLAAQAAFRRHLEPNAHEILCNAFETILKENAINTPKDIADALYLAFIEASKILECEINDLMQGSDEFCATIASSYGNDL